MRSDHRESGVPGALNLAVRALLVATYFLVVPVLALAVRLVRWWRRDGRRQGPAWVAKPAPVADASAQARSQF